MTEAKALAEMKRKCKVLPEILSDDELIGFLNDYAVVDTPPDPLPVGYESTATYDIRRSIYDALGSAITVMEQSTTRGGITVTYADLFKLQRKFATAGVIACARV